MRKHFSILIISALCFGLFAGITSCNAPVESKQKKQETTQVDPSTLVGNESKLMLDYLVEMGDYVNTRGFPSLIKPASVYEGLGTKQLVIDISEPVDFKFGHIKGAVNVGFKALPEFFKSKIVPFEYDKIILVSEDGQISSYATCLLRLMGYGNVYSMRWGMSGWHDDFAKRSWFNVLGSAYQDKLETKENGKATPEMLPTINTGKATGEEILMARVNALFEAGYEPAQIKAADVFGTPDEFYIMNYIRSDKYQAGHIPGAVRYKPGGTLGILSEMVTIPADKNVVVYCGTGHNSEFVSAYLRLFGYKAQTILYGNNSFMYDKMLAEKESLSWLPFTSAEIQNYPYEK